MSEMHNPTSTLEKPELIDIAKKRMVQHLSMPNWSVRQKLALTARILHSKGHESGLTGQISGRGLPPTLSREKLHFEFFRIR